MPNRSINLNHVDHYLEGGLTILRGGLTQSLAIGIAEAAVGLLERDGWDFQPTARKFKPSSITPIDEVMPILGDIAEGLLGEPLSNSTLRVNYQDAGGKQGWHQDYVPEPLIFYPVGNGFLDFLPSAKEVKDARNNQDPSKIVSIPVYAGDIAIAHHGGSVFHRGRNASTSEPRLTVVVH